MKSSNTFHSCHHQNHMLQLWTKVVFRNFFWQQKDCCMFVYIVTTILQNKKQHYKRFTLNNNWQTIESARNVRGKLLRKYRTIISNFFIAYYCNYVVDYCSFITFYY
jgi:hypothetical protein